MHYEVINKSFLYYFIGFVFFTILGTVTHELGHIVVARSLGYGTVLHFGSMNWNINNGWEEIEDIALDYQYEIQNDLPFEKKSEYEKKIRELNSDNFKITMGGILQTILFGSVGLLFLLLRLKLVRNNGLQKIDWLFIFLSLFWLREPFNLFVNIVFSFLNNNDIYFKGDEAKISEQLNLFPGTISILLGICGLIIVGFVIFAIIPAKKRSTFIRAGLVGGISGYFLWMKIIGPIVLP